MRLQVHSGSFRSMLEFLEGGMNAKPIIFRGWVGFSPQADYWQFSTWDQYIFTIDMSLRAVKCSCVWFNQSYVKQLFLFWSYYEILKSSQTIFFAHHCFCFINDLQNNKSARTGWSVAFAKPNEMAGDGVLFLRSFFIEYVYWPVMGIREWRYQTF